MPEIVGRLRTPRLASAPTSPVVGEMYYDTAGNVLYWWNGTTWLAAGAGAGPADATTSTKGIVQLAGDLAGTAAAPLVKHPYGTTLPASPADGQQAILVDSTTNPSYQWALRWNAGSSSAYKWEFVGGAPLVAGPAGNTSSFAGTVWNELIGGPRINVPRAGDYVLEHGCYVTNVGSAFTGAYFFYVDAPLSVAGLGPTHIDYGLPAAWAGGYSSVVNKRLAVATGQFFYIGGENDRAGQSTTFSNGWLSLLPIRLS